jgi:hypothetical protein
MMFNVAAPPPPEMFAGDAGASEELQHGRKFTAKRRQLPENGGTDGAPESFTDVSAPPPPVSEITPNADEPMEQPQQDEAADIRFGRGRR